MSGSALAQTAPSNTNIAGPTASASGNVTNQAVQVLQGPYAVNTYGGGTSCQGATFSISPFMMKNNNNSADPESFRTDSGNWGISAGLNIPLDGKFTPFLDDEDFVKDDKRHHHDFTVVEPSFNIEHRVGSNDMVLRGTPLISLAVDILDETTEDSDSCK